MSDGATKKPFRATGLLNKSQLKLASYIKQNKNVTLQGTKRFMDKSGEYYLKNIQMQNRQKDPNPSKKLSLNMPQNLENCLNRDINKIKRKASRIITLLPEFSLTPIPKKDVSNSGIADRYGKKELNDAQRTAVFIRRLEYATTTKRKMDADNKLKNQAKKIALIQEWWKTMYKIIKLQKNVRGFLFRKKLMNNLEHQEKLLQFITEFDNIHSYHLYKQFMDNLKKKRDYENSKLMEKCEDFNEKLDNLEKLHNYKNFKNCFKKWKDDTKKKKKEDYENLAKKLNDILKNKENKDKKEAIDKIKDKIKTEEEKINDKVKDFQNKKAKEKFFKDLIRAHRLNKMLNNIKNKFDKKNKRDAFDKLKYDNNIAKGADKLRKLIEKKMKKDAFKDLKTMDFVDKLDDLIYKHNNKIGDEAKKELLNNLKDLYNKKLMQDKFNKWKNFNDEMNNRMKIINKLRRHKLNELRKKEEEEKKKLVISSGINDFELISDKKDEKRITKRNSQIFTSIRDINILAKPNYNMVLSYARQNFSLIPQEQTKFAFYEPYKKSLKLDNKIVPIQFINIDSYLKNKLNRKEKEDKFNKLFNDLKTINNNNDLKEYFDKWKNAVKDGKKKCLEDLTKKLNNILSKASKESDDKIMKDFLQKLKKNNDIAKAGEKLENLLKKKLKEKAFDTLKKNAGMSEEFRILDKLKKKIDNRLKKEALDKLQENADSQRALEDLDKLLIDKYRNKFLDNLKVNRDLDKAMNTIKNILKNNIRKKILDKLKKRDDLSKGMQKLDKLFKNKKKKDVFEILKKNDKIGLVTNDLEKLINNKLRKKFLDRLKANKDIKKATEQLDKLIKNKSDKTKKEIFDILKKSDAIAKPVYKLEKLVNNKLKEDTFKKLKTMDFVKILENMRKKNEQNEIIEKRKILLDNLKKIENERKNAEKKKLKEAFDKFKSQMDKDKFLEKFNDLIKVKKQKYLLKTIRKVNNSTKNHDLKKYFNKWKENAFKSYSKSKRISRRRSPKKIKTRSKTRKNNDKKKILKDAFRKWRQISSFKPTRSVLQQIKKNKALTDNIQSIQNLNDDENLFEKYKKKVLRVLLNIYKTHRNSVLKKYFDKWRKATRPEQEKKDSDACKYKKRPKIVDKNDQNLDKKDLTIDTNSFKPTYYFQKQNLYNQPSRIYGQSSYDFIDEKYHPNFYNMSNYKPNRNDLIDDKYNTNNYNMSNYKPDRVDFIDEKYNPNFYNMNNLNNYKIRDFDEKYNPNNYLTNYKSEKPSYDMPNYTTVKNKNLPYIKKYGLRPLDYEQISQNPEDFNFDDFQRDKEIHSNNNNITIEENEPIDKGNEQYSDTSSVNDSLMSGIHLIENRKVTRHPRNYTSQSFFIDKNAVNNFNKINYKFKNKNNNSNTNQLPMTMKGDFVSLIEQNPKILTQKNPRIQVTNATCDLKQIIDEDNNENELNDEEIIKEIDKLENNYNMDKNKVLNKVIENCDKDLYASQKPFSSKKDQWYSVSIPLNDNEAKWEFLNNIKGERDKNNLNKFELIQNEIYPNKKDDKGEEPYNTRTFKPINSDKKQKKNLKDSSYKLQEMNYSKFYRSPIRRLKINEEEKSEIGGDSVIKIPGKRKILHGSQSLLTIRSGDKNLLDTKSNKSNFDRSRGKIRFGSRFNKSIENEDEDDDYNYSDD